MPTLQTSIGVIWVVFWIYWLISATGAKAGSRRGPGRPPGLLVLIVGFVLLRALGVNNLAVHDRALEVVGFVLFLLGIALAVWARVNLGRNWGMPMTEKNEPELVTSGPYRLVRHPIYSGILLAILGTALATNIYWLFLLLVTGAYFVYSARVEEGILASSFPSTYPSYRADTKMLIPFLL
jgi:protein-S-isoprenylcysteine O-methyltransferase Ste14